jgi:subtilisin family serine protease
VRDWAGRGRAVRDALTRTASSSQASIRSFLSQRGARVRPFWIVNALRVEADQATINALTRRPDVVQVLPDRTYSIPPPSHGSGLPSVNAVEWNIDNIRAPEAWEAFGVKGEGIVVANIDTGVQFDHPALATQYRGTSSGGVDHNYNWFDPSSVCGSPSLEPCDNAGHGTHTMGTMVGDDGDPGDNQIGVAPHAKWIAAKGCEDFSCSLGALLASAEWILAPTDLNGDNPRPDLRPNVVNNSWGGGGGDPFFQAAVQSWVAAGIFPAFSAGNSGPFCGSTGSPGDYPESYAAGAYDEFNEIAFFSSRGPSEFDVGKPNIAAPGVSVRSSVPFDQYEFFDGTSMASPHVAGTVALMWSAAPALLGDIDATRAVLDLSAVDMSDTSCGGTPENNNVWGEGRLDAFAALELAPRGPTGNLDGTISAADGDAPIAGATVTAHPVDEGRDRSASTGADGTYGLRLPVGSYDVSVRAFGYLTETASGEITEGATTTVDLALELAPAFEVSGTVTDADGNPLSGVRVMVEGTPLPAAITDASGHYSLPSVPQGEYDLSAAAGHCYDEQTVALVLDGDTTVDFALPLRVDGYGYSCTPTPYAFIPADNVLTEFSDEDSIPVSLPFPFIYYGQTYDSVYVNTNGLLHFQPVGPFSFLGFNTPIPDSADPNAAIYALWDDLLVEGSGSIRTGVIGTAPDRAFVVEWRDVRFSNDFGQSATFEIILYENGEIALQYASDGELASGRSATIGIEDEAGAVGLQYSNNEGAVGSGTAILYTLPPWGLVQGVVTDANDHQPIAGAVVRALDGAEQVRAVRTNAAGAYRMQVPVGTYAIEASRDRYETQQRSVTVAEGAVRTADFALRTAHATLTPRTIQLVVTAGQTRHRTLVLGNDGSLPLTWEVAESGGRRQTVAATRTLTRNPQASPSARDTRTLYTNPTPPRGWTPDAPGDVLAQFTPGLGLAWGVGFDADVWLSDVFARTNVEFAVDGSRTGASWNAPWSGEWPADAAFDAERGLMCQLAVGGDNGIHCWNPATGSVEGEITGSLPWTQTSQRGLAYRPDDDSFYVGGWNEGVVYHVNGLSHGSPGSVIESCTPADGNISGLAWNGAMGVLWAATNSDTDTIYELNPEDCTVLGTLAHPTPGFNGAGIEMDAEGNLWTIGQSPNRAYLIESGVPSFSDVPWLSVTPASGTVAVGRTQNLDVTINTTGLTPGVYLAQLFVRSNSGREGTLRVPISLVVTAYQQAANAGGSAYTDTLGDVWAADRAWSNGSWGYVQRGKEESTNKTIAGTSDQPLFRTQRSDPYAYRFDNVPNGIYQIDLDFAELKGLKLGKRLFDVIAEQALLLPAHDIVYEVGGMAADSHTFFVAVQDNRMDLRFVQRAGSDKPVVNALRITHRPDR